MSSERAGTPTHGQLNRDKARKVLLRFDENSWSGDSTLEPALDALEACVVPDPRIARIEALLDAADERPYPSGGWKGVLDTRDVRAILRGDQ